MNTLNRLPLFDKLESAKNILIAGAGGGFDIYSGLPLYFNLRKQGKKVILANLSFTWLHTTTSERMYPYCYQIKSADYDFDKMGYFPEKYLMEYLESIDMATDLYAFEITGSAPLRNAYKYLIKKYDIDTVILADGGTDSLMFGDEEDLGTPQEDMISMAAVNAIEGVDKYLVCVGFGVDHFHGVSHYRFLENVAELQKAGSYMGVFTLLPDMEESRLFRGAVNYSNTQTARQSIVSNSVVSALEGQYGNYHRTGRTNGSELWINPLMTMHWCFDLKGVMEKNHYYEDIKETSSRGEFNTALVKYRKKLAYLRMNKGLPI